MRILFLAHLWRATDITDDEHIKHALEAMGHEVLALDVRRWPLAPQQEPPFDFVLATKGIRAELIVQLKARFGCPVLYWCWDRMTLPGSDGWPPKNSHLDAARTVDRFLSPELGWAGRYNEAGARFYYLPLDVSPRAFGVKDRLKAQFRKDKARIDEIAAGGQIPVVFTGTWYGSGIRQQVLQELQDWLPHIAIHAFGNVDDRWTREGYPHGHRQVYEEGFEYLVGKSKICLSLDTDLDLAGCWSNRMARYMMCGGFTLARYMPGMERTFGPHGENLAYWYDVYDGAKKIVDYLEHEDERAEIAAQGQKFAQEHLTIERRVGQMLAIAEGARHA